MTRRAWAVTVVLGVLVLFNQAFAATPSLMNYQGILTNGSGTPQVGTFSVTLSIYDQLSGVNPALWAETTTVSTDPQGRFDVLLGSIHPLTDAAFSDSSRYLGTKVAADPEMTPRTRIVTVAYAFRPATVDGATGGTVTGDVTITSGDLDLDPSSPSSGNVRKSGVLFIHNPGTDNTFLGTNAGSITTVGVRNTGLGTSALEVNTAGNFNTGSGFNVLRNNTTGSYNTAAGVGALAGNTTGEANTAVGYLTLDQNVTGNNNTAVGRTALNRNVASNNTAVGVDALLNNTAGTNNTAIGLSALAGNTEGSQNTATGVDALSSNTTGLFNTAHGRYALKSNTIGEYNTASGVNTLWNNTIGVSNTACGSNSLGFNTSGGYNTACGSDALGYNTLGGANTASGTSALRFNTTGDYNTATGYRTLDSNTTGSRNTACGREALYYNKSGSDNTASGHYALQSNVTGSFNTAIGEYADVNAPDLINATAIGANAKVDASNKIRLGDGNVSVIEGQVAYTFTSDQNAKENFQPVDGDDVLRKLRGMNLSSWNYKGNDPQQFRHYGPVAQEFFEAFGHDGVGTSGTPTTINSGDEAGILMIAVQALSKRNQELESTVKDLASRLERIEGGQSPSQK